MRSRSFVSASPNGWLERADLCWLCPVVSFVMGRGWPVILCRIGPKEGKQAATIPSEVSMAVQRPG